MSNRITFAPPPWVTALLLRPQTPTPTPTQPRAPPSPMRQLVAQWLVYVADDATTPTRRPPHVIARFRGWLAFVFRIPSFAPPSQPLSEPAPLSTTQFSTIRRSLYFSSSIDNHKSNTLDAPPPSQSNLKKKAPNIAEKAVNHVPTIKLSPLYKSLYFSDAGNNEAQSIPHRCTSPISSQDMTESHCVQSFFLTDASGEGKGILEGLKEIKAQSTEPQRKRGWVPAVVSLILIALNPLK